MSWSSPFSTTEAPTVISSSAMMGLSVRLANCAHLIDTEVTATYGPLLIEDGRQLALTYFATNKLLRGVIAGLDIDIVVAADSPVRCAKLLERTLWSAKSRPGLVCLVDDAEIAFKVVKRAEIEDKLQ